MEAATKPLADEGETAVEEKPAEQEDRAVATPAQLFRYSSWVHVGPGADQCDDVNEEVGENACGNPLHFHAWCRLPNQFQHKEIREKGMAAKARRARQLRDPAADAYEVLEEEMDELARGGDAGKAVLVEQLVAKDWFKDYMLATREVAEELDEDGEPLYGHVERDQQRLTELNELDAEERPKDEFGELERHLAAYDKKVNDKVEESSKPRREAFEAQDINALIDLIRQERIGAEAMAEFMHVYNTWEWFVATLRTPRGERVFGEIDAMKGIAPEVYEALRSTFNDLERTKNDDEQGQAKNE